MANLEGDAQPALDRLNAVAGASFKVSAKERSAVALYVALMYGRSVAARSHSEATMIYTESGLLDSRLSSPEHYREQARRRGATDPDEVLEAQRERMLDEFRSGQVRLVPDLAMSLISVTTSIKSIPPYVIEMRWRLLRARLFPYFVMGDSPVTISSPTGHPGFASIDAEAFMPISPDTGLLMAHVGQEGQVVDLRESETYLPHDSRAYTWADLYNRRSWWHSDREVYGRSQGDLEMTRFGIDPDERDRGPMGAVYGPKEWERYRTRRLGGDTGG